MMRMRQAAPLLWVVTGINLMSLIDAINTVLIVGSDASGELNPLMGSLVENHLPWFFALKLLMTLSSTLVCWHLYQTRATARVTLRWISRAYCGVMLWQGLLLSILKV